MNYLLKIRLRKTRDIYCYFNFFLGRGLAIMNTPYIIIKYTAFTGIVVELINKGFGINLSIKGTLIFAPILIILGIVLGIIDVRRFHLLQKDNEISTKYNPYLIKLIEKR